MKAQKVIAILFTLIVIGGLAWYFNNKYLNKSTVTSGAGSLAAQNNSGLGGSEEKPAISAEKIVFVASGQNKEIWRADASGKEQKLLFTDRDEDAKVAKFGNLAVLSAEVAAATDKKQLVAIKTDGTGQKEVLIDSFGLPDWFALSPDGQTVCLVIFSNVEADYGYNLYQMSRSGKNLRKLANSQTEIKFPVWSRDSLKIYFVQTKDGKNEVAAVDVGSAKTETIYSAAGEIRALTFANGKLLAAMASQDKTKILDIAETTKEILEIKGGAGDPFISADSQAISYLVANTVYTNSVKGGNEQKIKAAEKILGWVK